MSVIRATEQALTEANRPAWCQIPRGGFFRLSKDGGEHDCHYHDYNELYLVARGNAKIENDGRETYVKRGDIVCIEAGAEHDIIEVYGDEDLSCSGCTNRVRQADASGTCTAVPRRRADIRSRLGRSRPTSRRNRQPERCAYID